MYRMLYSIEEAREVAKEMNKQQNGDMCAYIYDHLYVGYVVMDECDEPSWFCEKHLETWYRGELSYSAQ